MNRPLGKVIDLIRSLGLDVSYAYDDLVFVEHNAFLLRFGDTPDDIHLYFNVDCPEMESRNIQQRLEELVSGGLGLRITRSGRFSMQALPEEQLRLELLPE